MDCVMNTPKVPQALQPADTLGISLHCDRHAPDLWHRHEWHLLNMSSHSKAEITYGKGIS
jgi:hypothetical protein